MFVARSIRAMRFAEIIIIYLAAAAPVGVAHFTRRAAGSAFRPALANALSAATLWPLTLGAQWLRPRTSQSLTVDPASATEETESNAVTTEHRWSSTSSVEQRATDKAAQTHTARLNDALQAARQALYEVEDAARAMPAAAAMRQTLTAMSVSLECYAGLSRAVAFVPEGGLGSNEGYNRDAHMVDALSDESLHSSGEVELCRLANRNGDDLRLAALCFRRRHRARLSIHQVRARQKLLRHFDELHEQVAALIDWSGHMPPPRDHGNNDSLFSALVCFDDCAVNFCSLLEDEAAAMRVAQSLDTIYARRRAGANRMNADITGASTRAQTAQRL